MKALLLSAVVYTLGFAQLSPVLWRNPGPVETLDLAGGPGGRDRAPRAPFTFVKEETGGTAPKILVRDARGAQWSVKFGPEVKGETFASRIAWAAGYLAEPTYFVPQGAVTGLTSLGRAAVFIEAGGRFRDARFELRDESAYRFLPDTRWTLDEKALAGTRELAGLKLTIMLVSNWDVKADNNAIIEKGGQPYYAITDWGASMGRTSDLTGRSKWDCAGYARQSEQFVDSVADGFALFNYAGKERDVVSMNIRVSDVEWFMERMGKLTDEQLRAGLEASGATAQETACFVGAMRRRLTQLTAVAKGEFVGDDVLRSRTVTTTTKTVTKPKQ